MKALLVIDMINDFLEPGAILEVPMGRAIVPRIEKRIKTAIDSKQQVIFVNDSHEKNDSEFKYWPKHAIHETRGSSLYGDLIIRLYTHEAHLIRKQTYSGFLNTGLDDLLKSQGIDKLYITGILTNICVFITAVEAQMRGYETFVYRDSVATLTQKDNDRALEQLEKVFKITIL